MKSYGFAVNHRACIDAGAVLRMAGHALVGLMVGMLIVGGIEGCALAPGGSSVTLPTSAFFLLTNAEAVQLHAIALTQEAQMKTCHKGPACEDAHYIRGLVALFENRSDAITVFQQLHTAMPTSRYDVATLGWLNLLQDSTSSSASSQALRAQLRQEVLHTLLGPVDMTVRNVTTHDARVVELGR
ncbi:MAG: hypothetical protein LZF62_50357 [Nitrospira sp.]|nr:MAG: hypothetical protein LZF62_50357 [Nitrospira sp.]